jgi:hypothetical protein
MFSMDLHKEVLAKIPSSDDSTVALDQELNELGKNLGVGSTPTASSTT